MFIYECFNMINTSGKLGIIRISPLHIHNFITRNSRWMKKTAPSWSELRRNTQTTPQTSSTYLCSPHVLCVICYDTNPHMVLQLSILFQITFLPPLYNNSQATIFPMSIFTGKLQGFFQVKSHIYYGFYILLNHIRYVRCAIIFITYNHEDYWHW